jgi:dTDP-4-dehydrorhamnose reductase
MKIAVTGANGMVARAVIAHCRGIGDEVVAYTREDLDIGDGENVLSRITGDAPDALINCAAFTNVDAAESDVEACRAANTYGVENLAKACRAANAGFVTISTDYVFDGANLGFYTQKDTPEPRGIYAISKYEGELLAQRAYARTIVVRSGWIYGSGGTNFLSVIPTLLKEGRSIKAISDAYGTPTYAADLAARLRELAELDLPCVFQVVNSGEGTSYYGFAEAACELGGFDASLVEAVSAAGLERPAPRPTSSKMRCIMSPALGLEPMPDWRDALARFIASEK